MRLFYLYSILILIFYFKITTSFSQVEKSPISLLEINAREKKEDSLIAIKDIQSNIGKCYYKVEDYEKATKCFSEYTSSNDSLLQLEKKEQNWGLLRKREHQIELDLKDKAILRIKAKQKELELKQSKSDQHNLILITAFFGILVLFVLFFLINRSKKNSAKLRFIDKEYQLKQVEAKFEGQEKERNRLSSELHDGIGSSILVLKMSLDENNKKLRKDLDLIYNEIRMISHDLKSPYFVEGESVNEMTKYLIMDTLLVSNISVEYLCYPQDKKVYLTEKKHVILYRVLQEIFSNIIKHANTSKVDISYTFLKDRINLIIIDHGKGFDMSVSDSWKRGVGMQNIYSRIKLLDGTIFVDSSLGRGTDIVIDIPYEKLSDNN